MMKNKIYILIVLFLIVILSICYFYYSIAVGFGEAIPKVTKGLHNAQKEWRKDSINPLDSIRKVIINSTKVDSKGNVSE